MMKLDIKGLEQTTIFYPEEFKIEEIGRIGAGTVGR